MSILTRPILEIDLNKLVENFKYLQTIAGKATAAAVVKDDAYGLGAVEVAKILYQKADCRTFFVAHAVEGEQIYPFVKDADIYVLQGVGEDSVEIFENINLIPVINCPEQLKLWKNIRAKGEKSAIHIDTGLNRLGFREEELKNLSKEELDSFSMVISHLSCADIKDHFMNDIQLNKFKELRAKFFPKTKASLSASDGVFLEDGFLCDIVRLGAAVYGINTAPYHQSKVQNIINIKAPIIQISNLKEGDYAGYGATYRAASDRKIAIVSIGYGDGFPRILSNVGKIFFKIDNSVEQAGIIGRISMDNIICDITNIKNINIDNLAHIIGDFYTLDDMGSDAQTIGYEIISRFGKNKRFVRKYIS